MANWENVRDTLVGIWNSITSAVNAAADAVQSFLGINGEASSVQTGSSGVTKGGSAGKPFASGIGYVPYDNMHALLHRGEIVLPRQQAEEYRSRSIGGDMPRLLAAINALGDRIERMSIKMNGREVGNIVTPYVSENIAREAGAFGSYGVFR